MKKIVLILSLIMTLLLASCSQKEVSEDKLTVAVSIVPQAAYIEAIAGNLVKVVTLIPPGASPANYQPTPQEMAAFGDAELYFSIGVEAEASNILPNIASQNDDVQIVDLASHVDAIYDARFFEEDEDHDDHEEDEDHDDHEEDEDHDEHEEDEDHEEHEEDEDHDDHEEDEDHDHSHEGRDPHIWMSPKRVVVMVEVMRDELVAIDPDNADSYRANASALIEDLEALDEELASTYGALENKKFIVMHPSIGYMADDYGLEMVAIEEDGKDASVSHLQSVIDYAEDHDIHVVFYQEEFDSSQAETIASEIDGTVEVFQPLSDQYFASMRSLAKAFEDASSR